MDIHHLVKMVNEIGTFFEGSTSPDQAPKATAEHLKDFWEPRMRREIIAHLRQDGTGLTAVARRAVAMLDREDPKQAGR